MIAIGSDHGGFALKQARTSPFTSICIKESMWDGRINFLDMQILLLLRYYMTENLKICFVQIKLPASAHARS